MTEEHRTRVIHQRYEDPVALIWRVALERLGFRLGRSNEVHASYDGRGTLWIGHEDLLDADDHLGQMIFHELCHALVEGDLGAKAPDWGLDNTRPGTSWREHACLRTQAALAGEFGLRAFMAPTTDYRLSFWDKLADNPLDPVAGDPEKSIVAARLALRRFTTPRWQGPLGDALGQTAALARTLQALENPTGKNATATTLWHRVEPPPARHPAGHSTLAPWARHQRCEHCAWFDHRGPAGNCRYAPRRRLDPKLPACTRFEDRQLVACGRCGACCREAYDTVEVAGSDPVRKIHPDLIERQGSRYRLRREGSRCAALAGHPDQGTDYSCRIYPQRPKTCRDFALYGAHCLTARQRLGLSL